MTTLYHGVEVTEDYRWLEDGSSEETITWTKAQQELARAYLDAIPWRDGVRSRVDHLLRGERTSYQGLASGGSAFFALKEQVPRQRPFLVVLSDLHDADNEQVVVDPYLLDPSGRTSIDWFLPSPDGARVAVSISENGTEDGTLHVYDVASGALVGEPIPHVNVMGGSVAWRHDSAAIWYTLPADPAGFRQQVWFRDLELGSDRIDLAGGFGSLDQAVDESTDLHTFLFAQLGLGHDAQWPA